MQHINKLKDIGRGQDCLVIGGGTSVKDFNFSLASDMIKIAINDAFPDNIDVRFCFYCDNCFLPVLREKRLWEKATIIGFAGAWDNSCTYYFREDTHSPATNEDNTGLKAIIMLREIFGFEKIYLIGFDYYTVNSEGQINDYEYVDSRKPIDLNEITSHFNGDDIGHKKKYKCPMNLINHFNLLQKW